MRPQDVDRFWSKVDKAGACWTWHGSRIGDGYGHFYLAGHNRLAHRLSYQLLVGAIPNELQIDHLCRNRACVNPDHLQPVTPQVNTLRGIGPSAANAQKTHCPQGHAYAGDNLIQERFPSASSGGRRVCRTCYNARRRRREADRRAGQTSGNAA